MKAVITGGAGFLGQALARRLDQLGALRQGALSEIHLLDQVEPGAQPDAARVRAHRVELSEVPAFVRGLGQEPLAVFHLAAMVSAECEQAPEAAFRVNVQGTRGLLDACAAHGKTTFVFASSLAVFSAATGREANELTRQLPRTTYGMTKSIGELMVNDEARKGRVDGRGARLPTVIVRPGVPNKAASTFASAIFREPLKGERYECPVGEACSLAVVGVDTAVECFVRLAELDGDALGQDRTVNLPNLRVTAGQMVEALERVAGPEARKQVTFRPDAAIERIVAGWPDRLDASRARALGLPEAQSLESIAQAYRAAHAKAA